MNVERMVPAAVVSVAILSLSLALLRPSTPSGELPLDDFATLTVVADGRVKPIDTVARTQLMIISKRQAYKDKEGETRPAIRWLIDTLVSEYDKDESAAWEHQVFRIENDQVLGLLGLEQRPGSWRYSIKEFAPKWKELEAESRRAQAIDSKARPVYEQKVLELRRNIELFLKLAKGDDPLIVPSERPDEWKSFRDASGEALEIARMRVLSDDAARGLNKDELIRRVVAEHQRVLEETSPAAAAWRQILLAYRDKNPKAFAESITEFRKLQQGAGVAESSSFKAEFEVFYNHFAPFHQCSALYIFVLLLACASWVGYREVLNRSAFWLAVLTLTLHTLALVGRMYIQSRPPVTNLYSSAVFIGWGCVVVGLFLEWYWRNGIGNVVAATTGALTVMVAHHLSESSGDTLEMMRAVLDTNFWLATHVTCITLGYSATFLAGFLGILFILIGLLTPRLDRDLFRSLGSMIYGTLCFATLLSFVGTVLGGIWADQSWGRFWGWDPKENGALLIVLMNALILHARWAGLVKQRGMAILAVVGNMVVGWSWFGTNQLETGLHAYGFNNTLATGLMLFWASQLLIIGIGLVPTRHWMSFGQAPPPPPQHPAPAAPAPPRRSRRDPTAVTNRR